MHPLSIAYSPCPNDTYLFYAWQAGLLQSPLVETTLADVQQLNEWMEVGKFAITKASFYAWAKNLTDYILLPTGSALGHACGPKIIAKESFSLEQIVNKRIAIPGRDTTAHLLFQILLPPPSAKLFCTYDKIAQEIHEGKVDCGLIIHESRFTFAQDGFIEIADLGELWEKTYALPIPLGGIFAKRTLAEKTMTETVNAIRHSQLHAKTYPQEMLSYILQHSQEKDLKVIKQHIDLYVTEETYALSKTGKESIECMLKEAQKKGIIAMDSKLPWLYEESCSV